jgi:2-polyprenyl-6-methoxyphenol hydroxylase-like FAD-dependent oxidoreductase
MVGGGFRQGLYDVQALSQTMSAITGQGEVMSALTRYQRLRLGPAVAHVSGSERATAAFLAQAGG